MALCVSTWLRKYVECVPGANGRTPWGAFLQEHNEDHPMARPCEPELRSCSNLSYPETAPFGSRSDLKRSSTRSRLLSMPSNLVMWSRPALSRNASFHVNFVTPLASCRSTVWTASASGQPVALHEANGVTKDRKSTR